MSNINPFKFSTMSAHTDLTEETLIMFFCTDKDNPLKQTIGLPQEKLNKIIINTQLPFRCAREKYSTTIRLLSIRNNGRDHDSA